MANIGGNVVAVLQVKEATGKKTPLGEAVTEWRTIGHQHGWLGLQSGDSKRSVYNAKIEESSHVFLCDYNAEFHKADSNKDRRLIVLDSIYDILLIDNPDEMNEQLEIYLRKIGAYNGD